jgi:hypothetical protein
MPLTRERLQLILERLTSGYYEQPAVQRDIARRLVDDLR